MSRPIMLISTDVNISLTNITLGLISAIKQNLTVFKPILQSIDGQGIFDNTIRIIRKQSNVHYIEPLTMNQMEILISSNQRNILIEKIIDIYYKNTKSVKIVLIEGLILTQHNTFINSLNNEIANSLNAEIIYVSSIYKKSLKEIKRYIEIIQSSCNFKKNKNISGIIINNLSNTIIKRKFLYLKNLNSKNYTNFKKNFLNLKFKKKLIPIIGYIPFNIDIIDTRVIDLTRHLLAKIIHSGKIHTRRIKFINFYNTLTNIFENINQYTLIIISSKRYDLLIAICLAIINGIKIGAILLTGNYNFDISIKKLCKKVFKTDIPIISVKTDTWETAINLNNFNWEVSEDDNIKIKKIQNYISNNIDNNWISSLYLPKKNKNFKKISSSFFKYYLTEKARKEKKNILLPEGNDFRIIKAAYICNQRGIANCILLGNPDIIQSKAKSQKIKLNNITIINPDNIRKKYIKRIIKIRKNKGMTEIIAKKQLKNNIVLGTLMLEKGEVDGLVSGVAHTTADTIRPALQLIKTAPDNTIISSIFFMLMPEKVVIYGDCAINPNPNASQLAEIAIQSANSAVNFGIEPRIAMISYATGNSSNSFEIDKVRQATLIVKKKRPDLIIDGPIQYDAASVPEVALLKSPNSPILGEASIFIFPDLNTGNTTYKAVQRTSNLISIGPMLQGIRKPVNDLSRGAKIDDIIYTIALTVIQAKNMKN